MKTLAKLFENNRAWAEGVTRRDPDFFTRLSSQQNPKYLWIGCADSRVPANEIVGLDPGELFVHRNVANVVVHSDLNCLSVIQYAVEVLEVSDIIVCGHYGCGGVHAALENMQLGLINNWLSHIRDIYHDYYEQISALDNRIDQARYLCELNVIEQVRNVCRSTIVQGAWKRGQELTVHGWIYALKDGMLRDLGTTVTGPDELEENYRLAKSYGGKS